MRIVTHNVLRMQGLPELADVKGGNPPDVPEILARLYLDLKPHVVCLQEVQFAEDAGHLAELLGMEFRFEPGRIAPKYGGAVFVDSKLTFTYKPISSLQKRSFERICQLVEIWVGDSPVTICNLHLPSGVGHPEDGGEGVRMREITEVISLGPDVIVGDLNAQPESAVYRKLQESGYIDTAVEAGKENVPTCGDRHKIRIDYVWTHSQANLMLADYTVISRTKGISGDVVRFLSDHLSVNAIFNTGGPKG